MNISIEITGANVSGKLKMENVSSESEKRTIQGFFDAVNNRSKGEGQKRIYNPTRAKAATSTGLKANSIQADNELEKEAPSEQVPTRSRKLPLIGLESRGTTPIAELIASNETNDIKEPEHWRTGIKIDADGTKRYKCRYFCECGNQGNHYIPLETDYVLCHECEMDIDIENATGNTDGEGIPERDSFGNFFVAKWNN